MEVTEKHMRVDQTKLKNLVALVFVFLTAVTLDKHLMVKTSETEFIFTERSRV